MRYLNSVIRPPRFACWAIIRTKIVSLILVKALAWQPCKLIY